MMLRLFRFLSIIALLSSNLSLASSEVQNLQNRVAEKNRHISSLKSEVRTLERRLSSSKSEMNSIERQANQLESRKRSLESDLRSCQNQHSNVKCTAQNCMNEYENCASSLERCQQDMQNCASRGPDTLAKLRQINEYKAQIQQLYSKGLALKQKMRQYTAQLNDLNDRIDRLCDEMGSCDSELSSIQSQAMSILNRMRDIKSELNAVNSRISSGECEKSDLLQEIIRAENRAQQFGHSDPARNMEADVAEGVMDQVCGLIPGVKDTEVCKEYNRNTGNPLAQNEPVLSAEAFSFQKTHSISGNDSARTVKSIMESMRQNGWQGKPADAVEHQGQLYLLDGHHRVEAARRTGTKVQYRIISHEDIPKKSYYKSLEDVLMSASEAGPNKIKIR